MAVQNTAVAKGTVLRGSRTKRFLRKRSSNVAARGSAVQRYSNALKTESGGSSWTLLRALPT